MNCFSNKKILVVCPYPFNTGAGQRLKYEQYFSDWSSLGAKITVDNFFSIRIWDRLHRPGNFLSKIAYTLIGYLKRIRTLGRAYKYDYVYIHMWATPFGHPIYEMLLRIVSSKIIYDLEDNIVGTKIERGGIFRALLKTEVKLKYLIKNSDFVITSSPDLEKYCSKLNKFGRAKYITSSINCQKFKKKNHKHIPDKIVIGWTGTVSTFPYFKIIRDTLCSLNNTLDFKILIIGNFDYEDTCFDLEVIQWSSAREVDDLLKIDIGVYPLPDNDWVGGKSGLKAIQYQALGIPFVASNVGNTPFIMDHGVTGYLASTEHEWKKYLTNLIVNHELRSKIGCEGRVKAEKMFSTDVVKFQYRSIFHMIG